MTDTLTILAAMVPGGIIGATVALGAAYKKIRDAQEATRKAYNIELFRIAPNWETLLRPFAVAAMTDDEYRSTLRVLCDLSGIAYGDFSLKEVKED